jgi:hypothetical protein
MEVMGAGMKRGCRRLSWIDYAGEMLSEAWIMDCGSPLPLFRGSPAAAAVFWLTK